MPQLLPHCIPCPDISPECSNCPSGQTCFFVPNSCTACASASCGTIGSVTAPTLHTVPDYTASPTSYSNTEMQTIPTASGILPVPTLRSYTIWSGTGLGPYSHTTMMTGTGPWSSMTGSEMSGMPMSWSSSTMTPSTTGGGGPIASASLSSTGSGAATATASVVVSPLTASVLSSTVPAATVLTPTTSTTSIATAGAGAVGVENSLGALVLLLIAMFVR